MNAGHLACAASGTEVDWHGIDWAKCYQQVRRLQARIVKATQEGRWGKVKALQWLLTHSFSGKALAVRRVTENQGKKTPGVDQVTWSTPDAKSQAILSLKRRGYHPLPLRRVYIPKSNGKMRPLGIPTMKDRAMQALHLLALEPVSETEADGNSYGFRPERSTADAIEHCFTIYGKRISPQWILEGDIKGCFDHISHDWLVTRIPMDSEILRRWLKAGYMEKKTLFPTEAGTPQGGIISPTLANMVLDGLEHLLNQRFATSQWYSAMHQVRMVRYADDFVISGVSRELLVNEVKPLVTQFLEERGLELSQEKTRVTHVEEGFEFLGQNIRKYHGKLLITPSKKSVKAFLTKVRGIIEGNKTATQLNLIGVLNPVIRGWMNYHRHIVSSRTFHRVSHEIWRKLWQWAKRRHPKKGRRWIKNRYFIQQGARNWVFGVKTGEQYPDGAPVVKSLLTSNDFKIMRHRKIRSKANPFDPEWETYFEDRLGLKMREDLKGNRKLLHLWRDQKRGCPICNQKITKETGWNIHHLLPKSEGGKDNSANLVLLHPNCHRQIHNRKLELVKPVPAKEP